MTGDVKKIILLVLYFVSMLQWSTSISIHSRLFNLSFNINKLFPSLKFTSKQREDVNLQLLFVSTFMCIHAV